MSTKEIIKRYVVFIIGLFFMGVGVAFTKHGNLGVSPISSVPNFLSIKFPILNMGNWLIVWNFLMIIAQILILRKNFKLYQLLQIPLSFLFGWFTNIGMLIAELIPVKNYAIQFSMLVLGIAILGFGIALAFIANVIMNSGEALVKAISDTTNKEFSNVKIVFDICNVSLAIILSLIFFSGKIVGTREGTIISAVCTGLFVKLFIKLLKNVLNKIIMIGENK